MTIERLIEGGVYTAIVVRTDGGIAMSYDMRGQWEEDDCRAWVRMNFPAWEYVRHTTHYQDA